MSKKLMLISVLFGSFLSQICIADTAAPVTPAASGAGTVDPDLASIVAALTNLKAKNMNAALGGLFTVNGDKAYIDFENNFNKLNGLIWPVRKALEAAVNTKSNVDKLTTRKTNDDKAASDAQAALDKAIANKTTADGAVTKAQADAAAAAPDSPAATAATKTVADKQKSASDAKSAVDRATTTQTKAAATAATAATDLTVAIRAAADAKTAADAALLPPQAAPAQAPAAAPQAAPAGTAAK